MRKVFSIIGLMSLWTLSYGQMQIGVDVYNRYVWRGTDFGNSASIQPSIEYSAGGFTVGAWGAWSINGSAGGNENDLYLSTDIGPVGLTLTDYFFPSYAGNDDIFSIGNHILELSSDIALGPVSSLLAINLSGDDANSAYVEFAYGPVSMGFGNGFYTVKDDPDFNMVALSVSATRDIYNVSYILNPEAGTSFLVVGISI